MTDNEKRLTLELPLAEWEWGKQIFMAESWATGAHEGWDIELDRSGRKVVLNLRKGTTRIVQSIEVEDLVDQWVHFAIDTQGKN